LLTHTDRQTNKNRQKHNLLGGGNHKTLNNTEKAGMICEQIQIRQQQWNKSDSSGLDIVHSLTKAHCMSCTLHYRHAFHSACGWPETFKLLKFDLHGQKEENRRQKMSSTLVTDFLSATLGTIALSRRYSACLMAARRWYLRAMLCPASLF